MEGFPNLARNLQMLFPSEDHLVENAEEIVAEVNAQITKELIESGIPEKMTEQGHQGIFDTRGVGGIKRLLFHGSFPEVPSGLIGFYNHWKFERRWYYYAASGAGIPPEFAIPFDAEWGHQVRVNGDCACRGVKFWGEGFAISRYHIDTPDGLKAFIRLLDKIYQPEKEDNL